MAHSTGGEGKNVYSADVDLLLHPELLSQEFLRLMLSERKIGGAGCESRDGLTELYMRHVVPLPQRTLPNNRWGRKVERSRGRSHSSTNDQFRKRPPIVFHDSSSHSAPLKVKRPEGPTATTGTTDRLKPPPAANLSNPIRKLSGTTTSSSLSLRTSAQDTADAANLKRPANNPDILKSPEMKKKIQHVTWP
ncbi:hypothetical protein LDENG_00134830 [Lucifuga dentata]|nr:hypothetical protein LDENG_00134830 [Lucifuga dentata]